MPPSSDQATVFEGTVERIVFRDEVSGFTVFRVLPDDGPGKTGPVPVTGKFPALQPGEHVRCTGRWETKPGYGRQFAAEHAETRLPLSLAGIERYLGSGLIEGIGPAYASRIVAKFGHDIFEVLDTASRRLEEVEGIGPKRRREIKRSWEEQKALRRIMLFLHEHNVGTNRALRIYRQFGEESEQVLRTDPYRLAREVRGFGFRTADDVARRVGLAPDAPARLQAALVHLLDEASQHGHCALPREELLRRAGELLEQTADALGQALAALLADGSLVEASIDGTPLVFLRPLREAEESAAVRLRALAVRPSALPPIQVEEALAWSERRQRRRLDERQREGVRTALNSRVSLLTGGPGVGKTTVLQSLLAILIAKKIEPVLAAPTGRAAQRMQESTGHPAHTLHRLLEYQPGRGWARGPDRPLPGDFFVVDECSMVDLPLFRRLVEALPEHAHLLLVGDPDQLPSVGPGKVLADLLAAGIFPCVRLETIFRQARGSRIVEAAHAINRGSVPGFLDQEPDPDSDLHFIEREDPAEILATLRLVLTRRLPQRLGIDPLRDVQVLTPMHRGPLGTASLNRELQRLLNPPSEFRAETEQGGRLLRQGDKMIQTRNDYDKGVCNGDLGYVGTIEASPFSLRIAFDSGQSASYASADLEDLQHAYAVTVHKSQGSEFPVAILILTMSHAVMLRRNLLYTAVTRGRRMVLLLGSRRALALAIARADDRDRFSGFLAALRAPSL